MEFRGREKKKRIAYMKQDEMRVISKKRKLIVISPLFYLCTYIFLSLLLYNNTISIKGTWSNYSVFGDLGFAVAVHL
jgi:hypothetical protein